ncbi:MAG: anthranilate/aminodeoxychorismate synthase component II [Planctomycetes bacterium]|nr:anthranilate/aminodeoxychorismate synthase component II [Planctomycetota bacterium]
MTSRRILVVDNRDSFVFNLVEDLARLGADCTVVRGDMPPERLAGRCAEDRPDLVLLSPGPGRPESAGAMVPWLSGRPDVPVVGVCLGLQAMVVALGGKVGRAPEPVHGRATRVVHEGDGAFEGLSSPFRAGRYHSLVALRLPPELVATAWSLEGAAAEPLVMAVRHRTLPWVALQFHPESILSPEGPRILSNLLRSLP